MTNQPPDVEHFVPMLDQVAANCGRAPDEISADAGYFSESNVAAAIDRGVDPYIATGRGQRRVPWPVVRGRPPNDLTPKQRMARKLATQRGRRIYSRRKVIAEPPFGQIKNCGFRQFLLRGLAEVRAEWSLITLTHNLLELHPHYATA